MTTEKLKLIDKANILHAACILFGHNEIGKEKFVEIVARTADEISDPICGEQPQVADASKMERLNEDDLHEWSMRFAPDIRNAIEATAYHFWNLAIYSIKEK